MQLRAGVCRRRQDLFDFPMGLELQTVVRCCEQNLRSSVKAANMLNFQAKNACSLKPQERWDCLARDWSSKGPK